MSEGILIRPVYVIGEASRVEWKQLPWQIGVTGVLRSANLARILAVFKDFHPIPLIEYRAAKILQCLLARFRYAYVFGAGGLGYQLWGQF